MITFLILNVQPPQSALDEMADELAWGKRNARFIWHAERGDMNVDTVIVGSADQLRAVAESWPHANAVVYAPGGWTLHWGHELREKYGIAWHAPWETPDD